jgi:hypothetical protein
VIGFDIEQHEYGEHRYPGLLVIQDVRTLYGSQFKNATLIVASPPCQAYSYRAMPWKKAKALPPPDNTLFETCFRIQREASEAAGHHVPMIVENVRGAQKWVGRARWNFGSFFLWGDVPALMPITIKAAKITGLNWSGSDKPESVARGFNTTADQRVRDDIKNAGGSWFNIAHNTTSGKGQNPDGRKGGGTWFGDYGDGIKQGGDWFNQSQPSISRMSSSKSKSRKRASAMIAKIPLPLSRYIARTFLPQPRAGQGQASS